MIDDEIERKSSIAIAEARRAIENAEAALRYVAEIEKKYGLNRDIIEKYLQKHLTTAQRNEIDAQVKKVVDEIRLNAEQAVSSLKKNPINPRRIRIKNHI